MKKIRKILLSLILLTSISFLASCGGDGMGGTGIQPDNSAIADTGVPAPASTIERLTIPFREHGYSNFETIVIHSQDQFDMFITEVNGQNDWNNKGDFLQKIQSLVINFTTKNLLLFKITEPSGSIILTPKEPVIIDNKVTVIIDRQVPDVGTGDIANYALAYIIAKSTKEVVIENGAVRTFVDLDGSSTAVQSRLIQSNKSNLLAYFQESIKENNTKNLASTVNQELSTPVAADASSGGASFSSTNIQELGVDEADLVKTNGRYIYSVKKPSFTGGSDIVNSLPVDSQDSLPENNQVSSDVIRIFDTQGITEIGNLSDSSKPWNISGLYLHEGQKRLVALSSQKQNYFSHWFDSSYFANQETDVLFIDINDPSNTSISTKLSFEGQLIDSRRNGDTLYMVLRHYPDYQYVDDQNLEATTNKDFLPSYLVDNTESQPITAPENCYLENGQRSSSDIITLVAVDLTTSIPQVNSQCYVGSAEAVYASQNALYLATTRWNYQTQNGVAAYNNEITTDIHKFAYNELNFDYRGSGEVDGHLGFRQNSKSFRFSEHEGFLRVVTFDEDQWAVIGIAIDPPLDGVAPPPTTGSGSDTGTSQPATEIIAKSPVSVSILKEDASSKSLQLVSKLPNAEHQDPIGLPGEQLYASRFIGNRAYIVTFRVIDPLYVIDLSDPSEPQIAGELKIDGYSEYLHPISENLLLGVGKDAVPAETGGFGGDGRGAWYQGVKLSLVDITDPSNPLEADKVVLGKRGTESTALYSHHGLTGLKVNDKYRVAIPVQLHSEAPHLGTAPTASIHHGHTNTGLYKFEVDINTQKIKQIPALITNNSPQTGFDGGIFNDRSIIINDDIFYIHNGDLWSQNWLGTNPVNGPQ